LTDLPEKRNNNNKTENLFFLILKILSVAFFFILLTYHYKLLIHPFPSEIREGGELLTIKALGNNINPFALTNLPIYYNLYGIVYPLIGEQFAAFFGNTLFTGRLISAIAICFSLILIFIALKNQKINLWYCFFGVLIFYANILFSVTPITRPDSLGMLFFLMSFVIPVFYRFNYTSLFIGLLFCILSFYTKQYFFVGYVFLIFYLFVFKSIKKAIVIFISFICLFIISTLLIARFYDCYFYNTVLSQFLVANNNHLYAFLQLLIFFLTNSGLTFILLIIVIMSMVSKKAIQSSIKSGESKLIIKRNPVGDIIRNLKWDKGLFTNEIHPYNFLFCCLLLFLILKLGGNGGAYMTYYYQLLSFLFVIIVLKQPFKFSKNLFYLFILISLCTSGSLYLFNNDYSKSDDDNWKRINEMILSSKNIFSTEEVAPLLIEHGDVPYYSGYTDTFYASTISTKFNKWFPFIKLLKEKDDYFHQTIKDNIAYKKFDLLIINSKYSNDNKSLISLTYKIREFIDINFYHTHEKIKLIVWEPKLR
jgi:hypothetical protein